MSDLIRREEVARAVRLLSEVFIDGGSPTAAAVLNIAMDHISALPAVQPDLTDPNVVHANMLRGTIAKPTLDQIIHLYGVDALCRALVPVISREAALDEMARLGQEFDAALKGESHE